MKKKMFGLLIFLLLLVYLVDFGQHKLSRAVVDHVEAGNFINAEDIDRDRITMLHWFAKEVQLYSEANTTLSFVQFGYPKGTWLYANRVLIAQNDSRAYPAYQDSDYLYYTMTPNLYVAHRVNFYTDITPYVPDSLDDSTIFTGSAAGINQLIVLKESIGIIVKILLFLSIVLYVIVHLKQRRLWLIPLAALVAAIWFNVGIMLFLPVIYMASDGLFKKQQQLYALLAFAVIGVFVPLNALKYAAGFYLLLAFVNYYKRGSRQALKGLVVLAICYSMAAADLEFSFFKLFFEEAFMAVIAGYLMIESLWQFKLLLSKEQMIKVELLRGIAHDLRLPVSTISLNTDLLMRNDFDTELRKGKTLNIIKSALEDLTYMISSLSIYTANEHFVSSQFRASIQDAIQHTAKHFQNSQKHIVIRMDLCQEECYLPIEEIWLNRLIFNLVDNAYKYTDDYGEIDITLTREKKAICLSVKDNGIGIAPEARQRILEPFYRVDSARQATGMGLGLSIVKTIVDALGGEIHIESELGEYTVFEIRL